jgi:hypothetical protein
MLRLCCLVLLTVTAACTPSPSENTTIRPIDRYGWRESFRYRTALEEAVTIANEVLAAFSPLRFCVSWHCAQDGMVPVYLVDGDRLSPQHVVFVPHGDRCVVINTDSIGGVVDYLNPVSDKAISIPLSRILTFTLLHEAGHIHFGDSGSLIPGTIITGPEILAVSLSREDVLSRDIVSKHPELRADLFAVDAIEAARKVESEDINWGVKMMFVVEDVAWNLSMFRFGADDGRGLQQRTSFDPSYSHPNLEFRLLVVNVVQESSDGSVLVSPALDQMLRERSRRPDDKPYWDGVLSKPERRAPALP